ncbi:MAG: hypothetical protein GFH26_640181n408, partial [Chloroflexi bacterium AL-N15]|nr:hypothetical protein [Chloroflexi bacterium AL-N15]
MDEIATGGAHKHHRAVVWTADSRRPGGGIADPSGEGIAAAMTRYRQV